MFLIILLLFVLGGCITGSSRHEPSFSIQYDLSLPRDNITLIVPGMNQTYSDPGYDSIGAFYKTSGITPIYVEINWNTVGLNTLSAIAVKISDMVKDSFPQSNVYLFGFSFGGVICLKVSQSLHIEHLLLCSMSPLFEEDRIHQISPFRQIMNMVINSSSSGLSYSKSRETCLVFLYGDHDSFLLNKTIINTRRGFFTCNETHIVPDTRHDISGRQYLEAIKQTIESIGK